MEEYNDSCMRRLKYAALAVVVLVLCATFIIAVIALGLGGKAYDLARDNGDGSSEVITSFSDNPPEGYYAVGANTLSRWQYVATLPFARSDHSAATVGDTIYIIGGTGTNGEGSDPTTNVNDAYSPVANTWTRKSPLQQARYRFAVAVIDTKIYVTGGRVRDDTNVLSSMEVYDTTTDTWTYKAPLPIPRSDHSAFALNGKVYVTGGYDGDYNILNSTLVYDPSTNTWAQVAPLNVARGDLMGIAYDGKGYVVGGWGYPDYTLLSTLEEYDPANNTWIIKEGALPTLGGDKGFAVINGQFMVVGGEGIENDNNKPLQAVDLYDLDTGIWNSRTPLLYPALRMACATWSISKTEKVFCFGGQRCQVGNNQACALYGTIPVGDDLASSAVYVEHQVYTYAALSS